WGAPKWVTTTIFIAAALAAVALLRRVEIVRASLMLFLVTLIFLPGIGRQYFVWPIALGSLFGGPGYLIYTVAAGGFLIGSVFELSGHLKLLPPLYAIWGAAVIWLFLEVRRLRAGASAFSPVTQPSAP